MVPPPSAPPLAGKTPAEPWTLTLALASHSARSALRIGRTHCDRRGRRAAGTARHRHAIRRRQRHFPGSSPLSSAVTLGFMIIWLIPPLFDRTVAPDDLSDILRLVTAYALWSRRPWACPHVLLGLTLNSQAMLTRTCSSTWAPSGVASYWSSTARDVGRGLPDLGSGLHPTWRRYRCADGDRRWAAVVFAINRVSEPTTAI